MILLDKVSKIYNDGENRLVALQNVSLKIATGEFVAVVGPSGSGKSTLLHIIGLLDRPSAGRLIIASQIISSQTPRRALALMRRHTVGFIFQSFNLLPHSSAIDNVALPMVFAGAPNRSERARTLLTQMGLGQRLHHLPAKLSGGERQRVAIARALANNPKIILADEPTGNLDTKTGRTIMNLVQRLNKKGTTIVVVTHNRAISKMANRIIKLQDGHLIQTLK